MTIQEVVDGPVDASVLSDAEGNEDTAIAIDLGTITAVDDARLSTPNLYYSVFK